MLSKAISSQKSVVLANLLYKQQVRAFAAISQDCQDHLKKLGIQNKNIVFNPT